MMRRQLHDETYNTVTSAWRLLVAHVGGVDVMASATGGKRSHVSEFGSPHSSRAPTVAIVMEAEAFAGEPMVTAALAAANGGELWTSYDFNMVDFQRSLAFVIIHINHSWCCVVCRLRQASGQNWCATAEVRCEGHCTLRHEAQVDQSLPRLV